MTSKSGQTCSASYRRIAKFGMHSQIQQFSPDWGHVSRRKPLPLFDNPACEVYDADVLTIT